MVNLTGVNLSGANLTDANLEGAMYLQDAEVPQGWVQDAGSGRLQRAGEEPGPSPNTDR